MTALCILKRLHSQKWTIPQAAILLALGKTTQKEGTSLTQLECETGFADNVIISKTNIYKLIDLGMAERKGEGRNARYSITPEGQREIFKLLK